jgi:mono/diheme cytochrome c family protein
MNHEMLYPRSGVVENQLRALQHIRLFGKPGLPGPPEVLPRMPDSNDPSASIRDRARAYLHANCASCHMPGGGGGGNFDLRWHIADEDTRIIDVPPANPMGIADARLVAPGVPERSTIFRRINTTDPTVRMPPLATSRIDTQGRDVIRQWIESLDDKNPDGEGTRWRTY